MNFIREAYDKLVESNFDLEIKLSDLRAALGIPDSYTHDRAVAEAVECREARLLLEFAESIPNPEIMRVNEKAHSMSWLERDGTCHRVYGRNLTELLRAAQAEEQE